ncbi:MAG: DNA primase [Minisyncoccia bacterium]
MLSPLDEIKNRLDIVEVIGQYVKLTKAGANYKALCPFHKEKTPSFYVSPSKQIWHCFGCGAGGDAVGFVMKIENLEFKEALKILAEKAGVKLTFESPEIVSKKQKLIEIHKKTTEYFHCNLLNNQEALNYLKNRGLSLETIKEFKLGFALDEWRDLINYLVKNNFTPEEIVQAGLAISKKEIPQEISQKQALRFKLELQDIYDRFRSRIIFPIEDLSQNVIAFTARIFQGKNPLKTIKNVEEVGKYVNSPQTLIYDKSRTLFGLSRSKKYLTLENSTIVVEGTMDFLLGWQKGIKNIVATCGTSLTANHLENLKKYNKNLILAFDMDEAGMKANERAIDLSLEKEFQVKILKLPQGKDLADYLKETKEQLDLKDFLKNSQPIMEFYFERAMSLGDKNSLEGKKVIVSYFLPQVKKLKNALDKAYWIEKTAAALEVSPKTLEDELNKLSLESSKRSVIDENESFVSSLPSLDSASRKIMIAERLLSFWVKYPPLKEKFLPFVEFFPLQYQSLIEILKKITEENKESLESEIEEEVLNQLKILSLRADYEEDLLSQYNVLKEKEIERGLKELKRESIKEVLNQLEKEIFKAEKANDKNKLNSLINKFKALSQELIN